MRVLVLVLLHNLRGLWYGLGLIVRTATETEIEGINLREACQSQLALDRFSCLLQCFSGAGA